MMAATTAAEWKFTDARVQFVIRQYRRVICGHEVIEHGSGAANQATPRACLKDLYRC